MLCDRCTRRPNCIAHVMLSGSPTNRKQLQSLDNCEMREIPENNGIQPLFSRLFNQGHTALATPLETSAVTGNASRLFAK